MRAHTGVQTVSGELAVWREFVDSLWYPIRVESDDDGFLSWSRAARLSPSVSLSSVSHSSCAVRRESVDILNARAQQSLFYLYNCGESFNVSQLGKNTHISTGEGVMVFSDAPYALEFAGASDLLIVQVPVADLGRTSTSFEQLLGESITVDGTPLKLLGDYAAGLLQLEPSHLRAGAVAAGGALVQLFGWALSALESADTSKPRELLFAEIRGYVRTAAEIAAVTPEEIAREHFISRRQLYDLLADFGTTPGKLVRTEALARAADLLVTSDLKVTEIAQRLGFSGHSSFTRAFKQHFGRTPQATRG